MKMVFRDLKSLAFFVVAVCVAMMVCHGSAFAGDSDLRPVRPVGWYDGIAVMDGPENWAYDYTHNKITQMQDVYLNCAWKNWGTMPAPDHKTILYVGSQEAAFSIVPDDQLKADAWDRFDDSLPFVFQQSGQYQLTVKIEEPSINGTVDPKSEYTRSITVLSDNLPHLRPFVPTTTEKWSAIIVVSSAKEATSDSPVIYKGETSYINFGWINIGDVGADEGDYTANLYVDDADVPLVKGGDYGPTNSMKERTIQDAEYAFLTAGTHTLTLKVWRNLNPADFNPVYNEYVKTITVNEPKPVANFSGAPLTGVAPLTVQFTDSSINTPESWLWDFGDGSTGTIKNPSHIYQNAGTYSVTLTATNPAGSGTKTEPDFITVTAVPGSFTISATAGEGGTIAPSGSQTVTAGANQTFTITPDAGYHILDVLVDDKTVGAVPSYEFVKVDANHTISATFAKDEPLVYTISATAEANGVISPSGLVTVTAGANQTFTITPDAGYHILDVLVDGDTVGTDASYEFVNVQADHTISASFAQDVPETYTINATAGEGGEHHAGGCGLRNGGK